MNPLKTFITVRKLLLGMLVFSLAPLVHGVEFRAQGKLRFYGDVPATGAVYLSHKLYHAAPEGDRVFSLPVILGPDGQFDISMEVGNAYNVGFHHYPYGFMALTTPGSVDSETRSLNYEFQWEGDLGRFKVSRPEPTTIPFYPAEVSTKFCGLEFTTSPYNYFSITPGVTTHLPKNDWDGSSGWCPDEHEKLNTTVSYAYPSGNLLKNGSFEEFPAVCPICPGTGWDLSGMAAIDPLPWFARPRSGKRLAQVRFLPVSGNLSSLHSDAIKVKPNTEYSLVIHYMVEAIENWGSSGVRPMIRSFDLDGLTPTNDLAYGSSGQNSYEQETTSPWRTYVHKFKTGASGHFIKASLLSALTSGLSADFYFDDIILVEGNSNTVPIYPSVSTSYSDPIGKVIQSRTNLSEQNALFFGTTYDSLWRPILSTLPGERFVAADDEYWFDGMNGFMPRLLPWLNTAYTEAEGFPFSETRYEESPLGRAIKTSAPGKRWSIDSPHVAKQYFSTTDTLDPSTDVPPHASPDEALYTYHLNIGEGGEKSRTFTDKAGRIVRTSVL